ncbi:MAG: DUF2490 domain-containing protein [Aquaticitalea sp.]
MKRTIVLFFIFFAAANSKAQDNLTLFFEPEITLDYRVSTNYAQSLSIENRNFVYRNEDFSYDVKHLEIAHTSEFLLTENKTIGLGIQYRFEKNFEASEENEIRLVQEYSWDVEKTNFVASQTIKTEQRFYNSTTKYRVRYELGLKLPIGAEANYMSFETESLFELAKTQKPELEQRLDIGIGWRLQPKTNLEIGLQYRLSDYTQNLGHELFFVTSLDISL